MLAGEALTRVGTGLLNVWGWFGGKETDTGRLDYDELDRAYREYPFIKPIVKLSAAMLLANGFEVICEDERAAEDLREFWKRNRGRLRKAARDGALYGDAYMGLSWDKDLAAVVLGNRHPGQVNVHLDELNPDKVTAMEVVVTTGGMTWRQKITPEKIEVTKNGKPDEELTQENPYGMMPLVRVTEDALSNEVYGTGDVDDVVFDFAEMYKDLIKRAHNAESYHGMPVPYAFGINPDDVDESKVQPGNMLVSTNKDAKCGFLETERGTEGAQSLLKMLYHAFIVQSLTPEYLLGVHMEGSYASTKEQRAPIEMKTEERRDAWTEGIGRVNAVVLRMMEVHAGRRYKSTQARIEWGPIFEKDKKEEAETERTQVEATSLAVQGGLMSQRTGIEKLAGDAAEEELERLEDEEEEGEEE